MTVDGASSAPARVLPSGVVTFLFSDIEGSTKLLHRLGDDYAEVLRTHHRLMRECFEARGGVEVDTEGDAFFVAFASPRDAVAAAADAQRTLQGHPWPHGEPLRVRMGLHTGDPLLVDGRYVGMDVHRAARICSAAHGGQVVLSARVAELVGDRLPAGTRTRDLGRHRLKDIPQPDHLLQLDVEGLPTAFPALRTLEPPTNVPQTAAVLVGRDQEQADLEALITRDEVRLVTVTGPGGAGKTRLSGAVALKLRDDFPYGVYFVDLTHVREADQVVRAVGDALGVAMEGDRSVGEAVADAIADHPMLLVLDNFEQVLDGALPVADLLRSCPNLRVIATSRVLLDLEDEYEYVLPPLGLPKGTSFEEISNADAVRLFVERARKARHGFTLTQANVGAVARICELLDGLPLAIELAAARVKLFGPEQLLTRLGGRLHLLGGGARDMPERHRTLRGTIDWSFALLTEAERRCFMDLAVFHAGARLESIEAVLQPDGDVLEPLAALVNHSLVMHREDPDGQPRFLMLQTIRDYALERLRQDDTREAELRAAHAEHFLDVVEALVGAESGGAEGEVIQRDLDNVRAALGFWLRDRREEGDPGEKALRMATAMSTYWYRHGQSAEGFGYLQRALAAAPRSAPDIRATGLRMLGVMSETRQELDRAREALREAIELYQHLGDRAGEAAALNSLAIVERDARRPVEAEALLRMSIAIREELGQVARAANALNNLALLLLDQGAWTKAIDLLKDARERDRAAEDDWGVACGTLNLGVAHLLGDRVEDARQLLEEALVGFVEVGDWDGLLETLEATMGVTSARQEWEVTARLAGASEAARRALNLPGSPLDRVHLDRWTQDARQALGSAFESERAQGRAMSLEQATSYALNTGLRRR